MGNLISRSQAPLYQLPGLANPCHSMTMYPAIPDQTNVLNQPDLPNVSVVIPIFNGEFDLPDLLNCLRAQTYPTNRVEYLLVDNGSVDRTPQLLQSYTASNASAQGFPSSAAFRSLCETQIQSSYAARNTGIRAATGAILAFTDADCRPQPTWLYHLVQAFADPSVGIVAGEILALSGNTALERYADRHETLSQKHTLAHAFCPYGQTANLAIRRQALEQVGLFRPYLTTGGDADLCWRIQQQSSWRMHFAEQAIVQHRHRTTLADLYSQWQRYGRSNRYLHQLHGIDLTKDMTLRDYLYRWSRWLLKEVPRAVTTVSIQECGSAQSRLIDALIDTPIDLLCRRARAQGQRYASLPEAARQMAWLYPAPSQELLTNISNP